MKKMYTGLKAEKIDFGRYDVVTANSLPAGCIRIVANRNDAGEKVSQESGQCINDITTISYLYVNNDPGFPIPGQ